MEKIKPTILMGLCFILLFSALASAAVEITESEVTLDVDYAQFSDQDQTTVTATTSTITMRNTDQANPVTVIVSADGLPTKYQLVGSQSVTIAPNTTQTVTLQIRVPHKEGNSPATIGTVRVTDSADTATLVQHTKSMLELTEVEVDYINEDNEAEEDNFDESDEQFSLDQQVLVGTELTIRFQVENLFDQDYEEDSSVMESITLTIEPDDNDLFTEDIDEEQDLEDLDADESQEFTVTYVLNPDIETGDYTLDLTLEGEDGEGARYKIRKELQLEVARKRQDVRITSALLSPSPITVCDKEFTLTVNLENFGSRDQRYAAFSAYNQALGINLQEKNLVLDSYSDRNEDDEWRKTYTIPLKAGATRGTYQMDLIAYVDLDEETDTERVDLVLEACPSATSTTTSSGTTTSTTNTNGSTATTTTPPAATPAPPAATSLPLISTTERSYRTEDFIVGGIIAMVTLIMVLITLFVAVLVRK